MMDRVKQKSFLVYWKPGSQNIGDYFTKHHPPHHRREVCATYLYIVNALLKTGHNILHEWDNDVLTPIHTVEITPIHTVTITPNHNVMQGCANVGRTYVRTHKHHNSTVVRMTGAVHGRLSVGNVFRRIAVPYMH